MHSRMTINRCELFAGKDVSTCCHKYCLWSKGFASSFNFLPKFDTFQQKNLPSLRLGKV